MSKINFTKMNGAGNDFILIDEVNNRNLELSQGLVVTMCNRKKGIGADGVLFIKQNKMHDFELKYYNSDGFLGSLCGNGARCSIKYAMDNFDLDGKSTSFICNNQIYSGSIESSELITFDLLEPSDLKLDVPIKISDTQIFGNFVNTGSPHVVLFWNELSDYNNNSFHEFDLLTFGRNIRHSEEFQPDGTNVNLINIENDMIYIRTYERGVEDETLACGTGSVAAAIIVYLKSKVKPPIIIQTFGEDKLIVDFVENNKKFSKITLTGPAKINYIGAFNY